MVAWSDARAAIRCGRKHHECGARLRVDERTHRRGQRTLIDGKRPRIRSERTTEAFAAWAGCGCPVLLVITCQEGPRSSNG